MGQDLFNDPYFGPTSFSAPNANTVYVGRTNLSTDVYTGWATGAGDWKYRLSLGILILFSAVALALSTSASQQLRTDPNYSSDTAINQATTKCYGIIACSALILIITVVLFVADLYVTTKTMKKKQKVN